MTGKAGGFRRSSTPCRWVMSFLMNSWASTSLASSGAYSAKAALTSSSMVLPTNFPTVSSSSRQSMVSLERRGVPARACRGRRLRGDLDRHVPPAGAEDAGHGVEELVERRVGVRGPHLRLLGQVVGAEARMILQTARPMTSSRLEGLGVPRRSTARPVTRGSWRRPGPAVAATARIATGGRPPRVAPCEDFHVSPPGRVPRRPARRAGAWTGSSSAFSSRSLASRTFRFSWVSKANPRAGVVGVHARRRADRLDLIGR